MKIFGQHDEQTLAQLRQVREHAVDAALMADGHVGYVMPIGGVAAYRDQVSVVGVGFDIACLAAGTPVSTRDGFHVPIELVRAETPAACWDGTRVRPIQPLLGRVERGVRPTVRVRLRNQREIVATPDHAMLTRDGWRPAGDLTLADVVACRPFVGMPHEPLGEALERGLDGEAAAALRARGWWPLAPMEGEIAALVRLLGCVSGDGHLSRDGKAISVYTVHEPDAAEVAADFARLGFSPGVYRRSRGPGRRDEICVRVSSRAAHALFAALGSPVGRKSWPEAPMRWLFTAPGWLRAQFLSAFASAEMTTPRVHEDGVVPNLQLKQAGDHDNAIRFVARLCESLGFAVSVAPSGPAYGAGRRAYMLQVLGGRMAQVAFAERVGFCYAQEKRHAATRIASIVWAQEAVVRARTAARDEARALHAAGRGWRTVTRDVAARHGVSGGFVYHAIYDRRGTPRRCSREPTIADVTGELCWVPVESVTPGDTVPVYDVVTGDPASSFLAAGVVVHNCGNAAIRTDLTLDDLAANPKRRAKVLDDLADGIAATVSFGMGRRNRADDAPVDHPLFDDPAWDAVPTKERNHLRNKARAQLGTVGSGNHYVDVFVDEAGALWVGVHFGSRGFGHTVASAFLAVGQGGAWGDRAPEREVLLDLAAPAGHDYWHLMELAGRYAYAGREWVARKVVELLGGRELELVHNHHNFAWRETHGGQSVIVVRKGATPAFPGQLGFIGGSMGDDAVIVRGAVAADPESAATQEAALFSTVHGAGRVMSRTQAAGKRNRRTGKVLSPGRVSPEMMTAWVREKGVVLRGGGLDESPHVYRRLPEVLAAQGGTIELLHTLRPLVVVMAGADEFDPYKD